MGIKEDIKYLVDHSNDEGNACTDSSKVAERVEEWLESPSCSLVDEKELE